MLSSDYDAFKATIEDLCVAFDRPATNERVRVYWETLKDLPLPQVKRAAESARRSLKRLPAPADLRPIARQRNEAPKEAEPQFSRWAIAANKILMELAYRDIRRGFMPMADDLARVLKVKREYVELAEADDARGLTWDSREFNEMCIGGFEKLLGTRSLPVSEG